MHLVFSDLKHKEMLLAEPLEMTDVLFPDDVAFLECTSLKFAGPDLGNIMGKDRADGLLTGIAFMVDPADFM